MYELLGILSDMDNNSKQVQTTGYFYYWQTCLWGVACAQILCAVVQTPSYQHIQELGIATSQLQEILLDFSTAWANFLGVSVYSLQ